MDAIIAILIFLLPGLVCYAYSERRKRKENAKFAEMMRQRMVGKQAQNQQEEHHSSNDTPKEKVWYVDDTGNVTNHL